MAVKQTVRCRDGGTKEIAMTRNKAIKLMCTECLGWEAHPESCTAPLCPLYAYRGKCQASFRSDEPDIEETEI